MSFTKQHTHTALAAHRNETSHNFDVNNLTLIKRKKINLLRQKCIEIALIANQQ